MIKIYHSPHSEDADDFHARIDRENPGFEENGIVDLGGDRYEVTLEPVIGVVTEVSKDKKEATVVLGVGPEAPMVVNSAGGKQSYDGRRMDLMPPRAILAVGGVLHEGAEKYGENNWHKIPVDFHVNKAIIHLYAYLAGDRSDDHLGHAACRTLMAKELSYGKLE